MPGALSCMQHLQAAWSCLNRLACCHHQPTHLTHPCLYRIQLINGASVDSLDLPGGSLRYSNGKGLSQESFDLIVGTDGRNSQVREAMQADDPSMTVDMVPGPRSYVSFAGLPPTGAAEFPVPTARLKPPVSVHDSRMTSSMLSLSSSNCAVQHSLKLCTS